MTIKKLIESSYISSWFIAAPQHVLPRPIRFLGGVSDTDFIEMQYVNGRPPRTFAEWHTAISPIWESELAESFADLESKRVDLSAYCRRVFENWQRWPLVVADAVKLTLAALHRETLTPVWMVHGDATFSNVMVEHSTGASRCFDPGYHRGLCVKEIDESKVLQSYDGFDELYRGLATPKLDWEPRPVHWLLLVTHYARLLRHVQCKKSITFAQMRIVELSRRYA